MGGVTFRRCSCTGRRTDTGLAGAHRPTDPSPKLITAANLTHRTVNNNTTATRTVWTKRGDGRRAVGSRLRSLSALSNGGATRASSSSCSHAARCKREHVGLESHHPRRRPRAGDNTFHCAVASNAAATRCCGQQGSPVGGLRNRRASARHDARHVAKHRRRCIACERHAASVQFHAGAIASVTEKHSRHISILAERYVSFSLDQYFSHGDRELLFAAIVFPRSSGRCRLAASTDPLGLAPCTDQEQTRQGPDRPTVRIAQTSLSHLSRRACRIVQL